MKLTTCLLVKNKNQSIEAAVASAAPLGRILIGDIGKERTVGLSSSQKATVIPLPWSGNYSASKNQLLSHVQTPWVLFLEPWEVIAQGQKEIIDATEGAAASYYLQSLKPGLITKETRLWNRSKKLIFSNPIYESVYDPTAQFIDAIIFGQQKTDLVEDDKIIREWINRRPTSAEPHYCLAHHLLASGKHEEFLDVSSHYLFLQNSGMSAVLTHYYRAMVLCYSKVDLNEAVKEILPCIAVKPTMAEFWCLLGDIFYRGKQYEKAKVYYQAAIDIGSKRRRDDTWPVEIAKYHEHPSRMLDSCRKIMSESQIIRSG